MKVRDAFERLQREDRALTRHETTIGLFQVEEGMLRVNGHGFALDATTLALLCGQFDRKPAPSVPAAYLASMPETIKTAAINHHIAEQFPGTRPVDVIASGQELVGFRRGDLAYLSAADALEAAVEGVGGSEDELEVTACVIDGETVRLDLITHRLTQEVKVGDLVRGGVRIEHPMAGEQATQVTSFAYRLACQNGAVHRTCLGEKSRQTSRTRRPAVTHPHARQLMRSQIRTLAHQAATAVRTGFRDHGLSKLATETADFAPTVRALFAHTRLSADRLLPLLNQAADEEGRTGTTYDVFNALTRVGTHNDKDLSPGIRNTLTRMGGLLAFGHNRLCPRCWSLIAASN